MNSSPLKIAALIAALCAGQLVSLAGLKAGEKLPDLRGFGLEGTLPDTTKGKVVIVDFWASWCLPCAKSFPVMEELQKKYGDKLTIIAVNVDEKKANMDSFLKKHPVTFMVVHDAKQKLIGAAGPETMPTSYVVDKEGKVRFVHTGFFGEESRKKYVEEIESLLK